MSTTRRRDVLALLLGAPFAAEACRRTRGGRIGGNVRGGAADVGHRLRDATVEKATGPAKRVDVAIVGAGPSGLSAAWRLQHLGVSSFAVFDLEGQAGGTSAFGTDGVVPHPWGAHYVPVPTEENPALVALLDEMGVLESRAPVRAKEQHRIRAPEERVFVDGSWHAGLYPDAGATDEDRKQLLRFEREIERWVRFRDAKGRRAFTLPVRACSDDADVTGLDRITAARWLDDKGFSSKRLRWYVEYATRDDYGLGLESTSAWAMLFYFAARVAESEEQSAPFIAWPEGNGRLVTHLERAVGDRLQLGALVTDVVPRDAEVDLSVFEVKTGRLKRVVAKHVILGVPQFVAARILRPWRDGSPEHARDFHYGPWMVANVHLRRRPKSRGFPFAWDNVIYGSASLGYVVASHQKLIDTGPTVWTWYLPMTDPDVKKSRQHLLELDHRDVVDTVLADLGPAHEDLEGAVERIDVWKWGHAMIQPRVGFVWGPARRRGAEPVGRVRLAHSDLSGVALFEEAQDQGVRAAEAVAAELGREVAPLAG